MEYRGKKPMIISINAEKVTEKIQYPFMIKKKNTQQTRFEGNYHDRIQAIYIKPIAISHSMVKD